MQKYKISNTEKMMRKYNIPNTEKTMRKYKSSNPKYRKGSNTKSPKTKYCDVAALPGLVRRFRCLAAAWNTALHGFALVYKVCTVLSGFALHSLLCTVLSGIALHSLLCTVAAKLFDSLHCVFSNVAKWNTALHGFARNWTALNRSALHSLLCTVLSGFQRLCTAFDGFEQFCTILNGFELLCTVLIYFARFWSTLHGFEQIFTALRGLHAYVKMCYLSPLCVFKRTQMQHCLRGFARYHIAMSRFTAQDHCVPLAQEVWYAPWCSGYCYFKTIGGRGIFAYIHCSSPKETPTRAMRIK